MLGHWTELQSALSIEQKELYAIVVTCRTWGPPGQSSASRSTATSQASLPVLRLVMADQKL